MIINREELEKLIKEQDIEIEKLSPGIALGAIETFIEKYAGRIVQIPLLVDKSPIKGYRAMNEGKSR